MLNYKKDSTPFYNQIYLIPLNSGEGKVVHFLGVQSAVSEQFCQEFYTKRLNEW